MYKRQVNISGGQIGSDFDALDGSTVNISGGQFGRDFAARDGSSVNLSGGEFLLNGSAFNDTSSPLTLSQGDVLTGTLEDGSTFLFSSLNSDSLNGVNLIETSIPTVTSSSQTISTASTLEGIVRGQTLTVQSGGELIRNLSLIHI